MKLFITTHYFLSIIKEKENKYSCQVMELVHGMGMQNAEITDSIQEDVVSCIVHSDEFSTSAICTSLNEIADFHLSCLLALTPP